MKYRFGHNKDRERSVEIEAPSLKRAIRLFRVGTLFPHSYSTAPVWLDEFRRYGAGTIARSSAPDAVIKVFEHQTLQRERTEPTYTGAHTYTETYTDWVEVAEIPPETVEDNAFTPAALTLIEGASMATALTVVPDPADRDTSLATVVRDDTRHDIETRKLDLTRKLADLERMKAEANAALAVLQAELHKRMESIWLIELFLGSKEEVRQLRVGAPAPVDARIHVRQRVMCMDEEMAVFQWFEDPESIGKIDCTSLETFDAWVTSDPRHLDAICPWPKGLVGIRVRREAKEREAPDFATMWVNTQMAMADKCTYLLIRNGENVYRLWIDVNLWPRMFPSDADSAILANERSWDRDKKLAAMKQQGAGLIALTGLLQRSDLFAPLPHPNMSAFSPDDVDRYFTLVRDDEAGTRTLGDGRAFQHLAWADLTHEVPIDEPGFGRSATKTEVLQPGYRSWLEAQIGVGVRVMWIGRRHDNQYDKLESHVNGRAHVWPAHDEVYTIEAEEAPGRYERKPTYSFLYMPKNGGRETRQRRVMFTNAYAQNLLPVDFLSYRVIEHLIRDPRQRVGYGGLFVTAFQWWRVAKAQAERERPFVDLVLARVLPDGYTDSERARVERLLRWWKLKVKEHRTLEVDDAKALRMIEAAFRRGDDHQNDPEYLLMTDLDRRTA